MIYSFFADGFEEIEAITPVDLLRRAGKEVKIVGIGDTLIKGANGISVQADISEEKVVFSDDLEMIILPGGKNGTLRLGENRTVLDALRFCSDNNKYIAAICAAPSVLGQNGILESKRATCYPGFEDKLTNAIPDDDYVVVDGRIITARGAGVSTEFGLKLVALLCGENVSDKLYKAIQCR